MKNNKLLISFGSPDLRRSMSRFLDQGQSLNFYDSVYVYSINDLDKTSKDKVLNIIKNKGNKIGYGYSYWKPLIIKKALHQANENDIIHYVDLGCHLNSNCLNKLKFYLKKVSNSNKGILAFQYTPLDEFKTSDFEFPDIMEYKYTKADLLDYFKVLKDEKITHTKQYWAGNIILKKNDFTLKFIDKWIDVFEKRFDLIDNTSSKIPNFKNFEHNKSDQSVYSILCKLHKIESLSAYDCEWFYCNGVRYWDHTKNNPVIAKRDLKYNLFKRFINRQKKVFNRYYAKLFES
jgi:hypothetical protein